MDIVPQLLINTLISAATYILIVMGFNLIYSTAKFINMMHGSLSAIGGYTVFYLMKTYDTSLFISAITGVFASGVLSMILGRVVFRRLRRRHASNTVLFLASLGIFIVIQSLLSIIFSPQFQALGGFVKNTRYNFLNASITQTQLALIAAAFVVCILILIILRKTMFGKAVRAIIDDEEVAKVIGIDTNRIVERVFFLSGSLAGLAGIFIGFDIGIQPPMGTWILLTGAVSAIIGGIGNIYGGIFGAILFAFVENFGIWKLGGEWRLTIAFGVMIFFLILRPQGFFGEKQ